MVTCLVLLNFVHPIFTLTQMCACIVCMCMPFIQGAMYVTIKLCMQVYVRIYNGPDRLMTYKYKYIHAIYVAIVHWLHNLGEYLIYTTHEWGRTHWSPD